MTTDRLHADPGPVVLLGLSGSLRQASYNTALLRLARQLAPEDVRIRILELHDLPFYDGDVERREGYVGPVAVLRDAVLAADGLLFAAPEYNHSMSGVLKNAIDWASRGKPGPLDHKPAGLMSAAGRSGGANAQSHLRDALAHNRVEVVGEAVRIVCAWDHFGDGELITGSYRDAVGALVAALRARALERRGRAGTAAA